MRKDAKIVKNIWHLKRRNGKLFMKYWIETKKCQANKSYLVRRKTKLSFMKSYYKSGKSKSEKHNFLS